MNNNNLTAQPVKIPLCLLVAMSLLLFAFAPSVSFAYSVLGQSSTKLTEDTFLLQIDYRLNYQNYDTYAPVLAYQTSVPTMTSLYVQYALQDEAGQTLEGVNSTSIVLSDASLSDGRYYFADRQSSPFSLISIVQLTPEQLAAGGSLALAINWLPFILSQNGEEQMTAVSERDLTDFRTPLITWQPTPSTPNPTPSVPSYK